MASIIKTSINLNNIPKDKIIVGAKGKYLPISLTLNDEVDQFGNNGPVWTNGMNVEAAPRMDQPKAMPKAEPAQEPDLPF